MAKHPFTPEFDNLPGTLPIFPLPGAILLPNAPLPLNIFEHRYLNMVFDTLAESRMIGMIQPDPTDSETLSQTGCAGRISSFRETDDGRLLINLTGICRFSVKEEIPTIRGYRRVVPDWHRFASDYHEHLVPVDTKDLMKTLDRYLQANNLEADMETLKTLPGPQMVNFLSVHLPLESGDKQALVEANDVAERIKVLTALTQISSVVPMGPRPVRH